MIKKQTSRGNFEKGVLEKFHTVHMKRAENCCIKPSQIKSFSNFSINSGKTRPYKLN